MMLLALIAALALAQQYPLFSLPFTGTFIVYWLVFLGLFLLTLNQNLLKISQGILVLLLGFEMWYGPLSEDFGLLRGLGVVQLLVAIVCGTAILSQETSQVEKV